MKQVRQQKICLSMVLVQFLFAGIVYSLVLKFRSQQPTVFLEQCFNVLLMGGLISLLAWRHSSMAWSAFVEKRDSEQKPQKDNIFTDESDFTGRQERAFIQFNKILMPAVLVVYSLLEIYLSGRLLFLEPEIIDKPQGSLLIPAAIITALALMLFLTGKYCSGLAFDEKTSFFKAGKRLSLIECFYFILCLNICTGILFRNARVTEILPLVLDCLEFDLSV